MVEKLYINLGLIGVQFFHQGYSYPNLILKLNEINIWCKKTLDEDILFDVLSLNTRIVFQSKADMVAFKLYWSKYISKNELDNL